MLEDLVNITFSNDQRVFAVMAALNASGFDYEKSGKMMSPERQSLREQIQDTDASLIHRLKTYYSSHRRYADEIRESADYLSLALHLSDVPTLTFPENTENLPSNILRLRGFSDLVREFYQKAGIDTLWATYRDNCLLEIARYRPILKQLIYQTLRYFRVGPRRVLDRTIIFIPDLLNAQNTLNARNMDRIYYILVGPSADPTENYISLQHEYLHVLIDPLVEKFIARLGKDVELLRLANNQPRLNPEYRNQLQLIVAESMIESLLLKIHPNQDVRQSTVDFFRQGLVALPSFYRQLSEYESSQLLSFPAYAELLFQDLAQKDLEKDLADIITVEKQLADADRTRQEALQRNNRKIERENRLNALLTEAGQLLSEKNWDAAGSCLKKLLQEDPKNGNAHFYLAQIAAQKQDSQGAFDFYRKASVSEAPVWVRAWSIVRMGRILASQGSFIEALKHFQDVLDLKGDLKGAKEQATESAKELGSKL